MVKITDLPVTAPPPEGTLSYEIDGTRYDLCPHANGEEVVMVTTRADEPNRVESAWTSLEHGVPAFHRNMGRGAVALPEGTPMRGLAAYAARKRLAEEREPPSVILAGILRP